jgi:hypothetical protein
MERRKGDVLWIRPADFKRAEEEAAVGFVLGFLFLKEIISRFGK